VPLLPSWQCAGNRFFSLLSICSFNFFHDRAKACPRPHSVRNPSSHEATRSQIQSQFAIHLLQEHSSISLWESWMQEYLATLAEQ